MGYLARIKSNGCTFLALLAYCLVFVLICTSMFAADMDTVDSKIDNVSLNKYIDTTLSYYLTLGEEVYDQVELSNPMSIENHSNSTISNIFCYQ